MTPIRFLKSDEFSPFLSMKMDELAFKKLKRSDSISSSMP
jgi:hypothetical protein